MSKQIRAPPAPQVQLTPDDETQLRALGVEMEQELLSTYEDFLHREKRVVDVVRWKHMLSHDNMHIFREREATPKAFEFLEPTRVTTTSKRDFTAGPHTAMASCSRMPLLMATGTAPGTLDDAIYGTTFHDTATLRARNAYQKTSLEDNAVVATLDGATHDDPFRFLGLVWYYKVYPMAMGLISNRELLMLVAVHSTTLRSGERVGVAMYHSVEHRDAPKPRDQSALRADFSLLVLRRQLDDQNLEVFVMAFVEPYGSTPGMLIVQDAAKSMLHVTEACEVAFRRKLLFRVREAERHRRRSGTRIDTKDQTHCARCKRSFNSFFVGSGCTCRICAKRVCSKCSLSRDIVLETTDTSITTKPFSFCTACASQTQETSALAIAREEQYARAQSSAHDPLRSSFSWTSSTGSV